MKAKSFLALHSLGREKAKGKLSQKSSGEGQRSKMRLSPGLLSGPEVTTPRRNTTGKKQPRRTERSNSVEDNQNQTWSRANQHRYGRKEGTFSLYFFNKMVAASQNMNHLFKV